MNPDLDLFAHDEPSIDLTPLIDVIFMLLIFFILAGSLVPPSLKVDLPQASSASHRPRQHEPLRLTIDSDGRIHHGGQVVDPPRLPELLAGHGEHPVELEVDSRAPFAPVLRVLDQARLQGREDLRILARPAATDGLVSPPAGGSPGDVPPTWRR